MDAFGNIVSIKTTLTPGDFFRLLSWFNSQEVESLDWIELKNYSSSQIGQGAVVLIHVTPGKAFLHSEWQEVLKILGFKESPEEQTLFSAGKACTNCGFHNLQKAKFCSVCGDALKVTG